MFEVSEDVMGRIRQCVGQIKGEDFSSTPSDYPLELDSINRITLIAELENEFELVIGSENIAPEAFETLGSLTVFIEGTVQNQ